MKITRLQSPWDENDLGGKRPGKSVCFVRYGGFGDMVQASSVFPYYKDNGWYITVNTGDRGYDIIKHDPHIDEVFIQEQGQVENQDLSAYWGKLSECFNHFVQFSESIEGKLLAIPGRPEYQWEQSKRHSKMNKDYFHQMHELAEAPLPPRPNFYPSPMEKRWAKNFRKKLGRKSFVIMWALSGSSVHKAYPHMDEVIAGLMHYYDDIQIVMVGDALCQLLEENWRFERRVIRKSNKISIRKTLTLAKYVDMVIGPETGVLNAVAFKPVPKIIMLSHSSPENIGKNWVNTITLEPKGVHCFPCHQMHYGFNTCNRDEETGGAMCAAKICPHIVFEAITKLKGTV